MNIDFTPFLWLNWMIAGFCFTIGYIVASAIYAAILSVLNRGKTG